MGAGTPAFRVNFIHDVACGNPYNSQFISRPVGEFLGVPGPILPQFGLEVNIGMRRNWRAIAGVLIRAATSVSQGPGANTLRPAFSSLRFQND